MEIFSNEVAYSLQYFTFPLEVIGLSLAAIEVRFPTTARNIAEYLDRLAEPYRQAESERTGLWEKVKLCWQTRKPLRLFVAWWRWFHQYYMRKTLVGGIAIYLFITIGFILLLMVGAFLAKNMFGIDWPVRLILWSPVLDYVGIVWSLGISVYILLFSITGASAFTQRFVEGRAVGTLGIIIAGFGVLGEAYQFTTQLVV